MTQFEYVSVLTSLILGLGVTQILTSVSDVILTYDRIKFYPLHTIWVILVFGFHIQEWWINFGYSRVIMDWRIINFLFLISYPITLFILARLLFPSKIASTQIDFKKFFQDNQRMIFSVAFFLPVISIPQNMMLGYTLFEQSGQLIIAAVFLFLALTNTKNRLIHYGFAIALILVSIHYMFYLNPKL